MLVLTRKVGERINIGDDILIQVVEIGKGSVRIGIAAPGRVSILRQEVYERIQEQNLQSAQGASADVAKVAHWWRDKTVKESGSED